MRGDHQAGAAVPEVPLAVVEMVQRMTALDPGLRPRDCNVVATGMNTILTVS